MGQIIREINALTGSPVGLVIVSLFAGIVLSVIASLYHRCVSGIFVRALIHENADSPRRGKTLRELGLWKNIFVRIALLGKGSILRRITAVAEETSRNSSGAEGRINGGAEELSDESVILSGTDTPEGADIQERICISDGEKLSFGVPGTARKAADGKVDVKRRTQKTPLRDCRFYIPPENREKAEALFGGGRQNPLLILIFLVILALLGIGLIKLIPYVFQL